MAINQAKMDDSIVNDSLCLDFEEKEENIKVLSRVEKRLLALKKIF